MPPKALDEFPFFTSLKRSKFSLSRVVVVQATVTDLKSTDFDYFALTKAELTVVKQLNCYNPVKHRQYCSRLFKTLP